MSVTVKAFFSKVKTLSHHSFIHIHLLNLLTDHSI